MVLGFGAGTASAALPGQNGAIAFDRYDGTDDEIFAMGASGQNPRRKERRGAPRRASLPPV
jgi:hypothetical protein